MIYPHLDFGIRSCLAVFAKNRNPIITVCFFLKEQFAEFVTADHIPDIKAFFLLELLTLLKSCIIYFGLNTNIDYF
jgi:hypothetical protein